MKFLQFLRIVDEQGQLSITNLAVLAAILNLALRQDVTPEAVGIFITTIAGYQVKRFTKSKAPQDEDEVAALKESLAKLESTVTAIHLGRRQTLRK